MQKQIIEVGKSVARAFFGTLLAALVASGIGVLSWDSWSDWKVPVGAACVAAGVVVLNALNWKDSRYGVGASS